MPTVKGSECPRILDVFEQSANDFSAMRILHRRRRTWRTFGSMNYTVCESRFRYTMASGPNLHLHHQVFAQTVLTV